MTALGKNARIRQSEDADAWRKVAQDASDDLLQARERIAALERQNADLEASNAALRDEVRKWVVSHNQIYARVKKAEAALGGKDCK